VPTQLVVLEVGGRNVIALTPAAILVVVLLAQTSLVVCINEKPFVLLDSHKLGAIHAQIASSKVARREHG